MLHSKLVLFDHELCGACTAILQSLFLDVDTMLGGYDSVACQIIKSDVLGISLQAFNAIGNNFAGLRSYIVDIAVADILYSINAVNCFNAKCAVVAIESYSSFVTTYIHNVITITAFVLISIGKLCHVLINVVVFRCREREGLTIDDEAIIETVGIERLTIDIG